MAQERKTSIAPLTKSAVLSIEKPLDLRHARLNDDRVAALGVRGVAPHAHRVQPLHDHAAGLILGRNDSIDMMLAHMLAVLGVARGGNVQRNFVELVHILASKVDAQAHSSLVLVEHTRIVLDPTPRRRGQALDDAVDVAIVSGGGRGPWVGEGREGARGAGQGKQRGGCLEETHGGDLCDGP